MTLLARLDRALASDHAEARARFLRLAQTQLAR
jgi:hypothetical protein